MHSGQPRPSCSAWRGATAPTLLPPGWTRVIAYTEKIVRGAIEEIPDGVYTGEDYADTDGFSDQPVPIKVTLTISGSDITIDFAGSAPITKGAINSPMANTAPAAS